MSGRRSHQRVDVTLQWKGTMRVNRDVVVRRVAPDTLVVTSREPAKPDERLWVLLPDDDDAIRVRVAESHPVVVQGAVRYLLRLDVIDAAPVGEGAYLPGSLSNGGVNG